MATEITQVIGTLAAVYGWYVEPIGWRYALGVWGYALGWFLVNSGVKVMTYRLLAHQARHQAGHLRRVESALHGAGK